jgi:hypothetical protein
MPHTPLKQSHPFGHWGKFPKHPPEASPLYSCGAIHWATTMVCLQAWRSCLPTAEKLHVLCMGVWQYS